MSKKLTVFIFTVLLLALGLCFFYMKLVFSEYVAYSHQSIEHWFLTPNELKNIPSVDYASTQYVYNAADGNKPARYTLKPRNNVSVLVVAKHIESIGFTRDENNNYRRDNLEFLIEPSADKAASYSITLLEYL